ncbi:MAG: hypothetical protein F4107_09230 [Gemmatimonadetes bacterium]|nr:hypothetical protein [Gemmatimonadota bacterium]MYD13683.1 hypothetical protein [Gemmatimonadota bacterium]MYI66098.1 hypothetical protein [Gemmatimonadota bacterium]
MPVAGIPGLGRGAMKQTTGSEFRILRNEVEVGRDSGRRGAGGSRVCRPWFLALYSDYRDDRLDEDTRAEVIAHMAECASCRRYDRVIRTGVAVLRDSVGRDPGVLVNRDEEDDDGGRRVARRSGPVASGIAVTTTLAIIGLNGIAAWVPVPASVPPEVEIAPVVAAEPSTPPAPVTVPMPPLLRVPATGPEPGDTGDAVTLPRIQISVVAPVDR